MWEHQSLEIVSPPFNTDKLEIISNFFFAFRAWSMSSHMTCKNVSTQNAEIERIRSFIW